MRRRILTILLAVLVLAVAVPIGAALTLERRLPLSSRSFPRATNPTHGPAPPLSETAGLALAGTAFIGLAVAVRRGV